MQPIRYENMTKSLFLSLFLLVNCFVFTAQAIEVTQLYTAKVAVDGQSNAERADGLKQAMKQVMLKVGGNSDFEQDASIKSALTRPQAYVAQFYYDRVDQQSMLIAEFDELKVNQLFYQAGLPILGSIRPLLTVWLIEEDNLERKIIDHSSEHLLAQKVQSFSAERAVPMVLPLMDLEDINRVQVSDVWGRFAEPVKEASERYLAEASVIIRVSNNTLVEPVLVDEETCEAPCQVNQYALDWSILEGVQQFGERLHGNSPELLLEQALESISAHIHQQYALSTDTTNVMTIEIANVDSMKTFVEISQFLSDFSAVSSVKLRYAEGEVRRFDIGLIGSEQTFMASVKLVDELQQIIDPLADIDEQAIPVFYWQK